MNTEPKALKIINLASLEENTENVYIKNESNSTAIQVPKKVLNTLDKINNLRINLLFVDVLATAINKRRLMNIDKAIDTWNKSTPKDHRFPPCKENTSFYKLISTFFKELCDSSITEMERKELIYFFARCPHGYDVTRLIRAHHELNPVIT